MHGHQPVATLLGYQPGEPLTLEDFRALDVAIVREVRRFNSPPDKPPPAAQPRRIILTGHNDD